MMTEIEKLKFKRLEGALNSLRKENERLNERLKTPPNSVAFSTGANDETPDGLYKQQPWHKEGNP